MIHSLRKRKRKGEICVGKREKQSKDFDYRRHLPGGFGYNIRCDLWRFHAERAGGRENNWPYSSIFTGQPKRIQNSWKKKSMISTEISEWI